MKIKNRLAGEVEIPEASRKELIERKMKKLKKN